MTKIIALGHQSRVGKDTLGEILARSFGFAKVKKFAFANILKLIAAELFWRAGLHDPCYYEKNPSARTKKLKNGLTPVETWTRFGNYCRDVWPDVWVKILEDEIADHGYLDVAIITDLRFPNEADWVKSQNGKVIKVERDSAVINASDAYLELYDQWDLVVDNNGTLDDLKKWAERIASL